MLCRGTLLLLNTKKISAGAMDFAADRRCNAAEVYFCAQRNWGNHRLVHPYAVSKIPA